MNEMESKRRTHRMGQTNSCFFKKKKILNLKEEGRVRARADLN